MPRHRRQIFATLGVLALSASAASAQVAPHLRPQEPAAAQLQPSALTDGWQPAETRFAPGIRQGTTPEGFLYTYDRSGSAHVYPFTKALSGPGVNFNAWDIKCAQDPVTDKHLCEIHFTGYALIINTDNAGDPSVMCVDGQDELSLNSAAMRIDQDPALTMNIHGCAAMAPYVDRLTRGTSIILRHYEGYNGAPVDQTLALAGLSSALSLAKFMTQDLGQVAFP